jgi:myo-inositol-1(or 4)-monophosphatase
MESAQRTATAERAARAGADAAMEQFRTDLAVETKTDKTDVVTRADREAQREALAVIDAARPGETVVAEEADAAGTVPERGRAWVVDPIDGTNNYVRGAPLWTTAVAAVEDRKAVAGAVVAPVLGDAVVGDAAGVTLNGRSVAVSERSDPETFSVGFTLRDGGSADRFGRVCGTIVEELGDLRRFGSAQATLAMVASGQLDAAVGISPADPWDTLAGVGLIRAAGGRVTDAEGSEWTPDDGTLVASNGRAHGDVLASLGT